MCLVPAKGCPLEEARVLAVSTRPVDMSRTRPGQRSTFLDMSKRGDKPKNISARAAYSSLDSERGRQNALAEQLSLMEHLNEGCLVQVERRLGEAHHPPTRRRPPGPRQQLGIAGGVLLFQGTARRGRPLELALQ